LTLYEYSIRMGNKMEFGSSRTLVGVLGMVVACLVGVALASGQAPPGSAATPAEKPQMAEDVFKNVQVLKGIPVDEFMGTMGFFSAALNLNCTDCHVEGALTDWNKYADDTPLKKTARTMVLMVKTINQANFRGQRAVTCYTCHRGSNRPKVDPSLAEQYGSPPDVDPNEVESLGKALTPGSPTADQILDKYIQAVGGAQKLASLTSFVAKGTYEGFDTADHKVPVEVYAKAPAQRAVIAHVPVGDGLTKDSTTTYNGSAGWVAARSTFVPMFALTGQNLDGAKVDANLSFPGGIKQALGNWRAAFPDTSIDGHAVQVVEGTTAGRSQVKLYFDKQTGLLVRQVRWANTVVGRNPTQVDYSDYRDVAGIKFPFHWTLTWTDGQSNYEMSEVQVNAPIDAAKFAKPAP
jgi:photosynthetic reaction center cytochrome c subunit